jgi:single-strand DNA-binding protein
MRGIMRNVNKLILLGYVGRDPRAITGGVILTVLTKEYIKTAEGWKTEKEWHTVKVFNQRQVETALSLKKGDPVYVEGKLRSVEYEKDGRKVTDKQVYAEMISGIGNLQDSEGVNGNERKEHEYQN